jgi:hypothetical protein
MGWRSSSHRYYLSYSTPFSASQIHGQALKSLEHADFIVGGLIAKIDAHRIQTKTKKQRSNTQVAREKKSRRIDENLVFLPPPLFFDSRMQASPCYNEKLGRKEGTSSFLRWRIQSTMKKHNTHSVVGRKLLQKIMMCG